MAHRHGLWIARVLLLGSAACFALMSVLARRLSRDEGAFTSGQLALVRFAIGALVSLAVFRLIPGSYRPVNYRLLISRGIFGGIVVLLQFAALARIPAGEAALLYNLFPVIATGMAFLTFDERPTKHLVFAVLLATGGVALVLTNGSVRMGIGLGEAAALGAAVFAATNATVIRAMRRTDNAPTIFFFFSAVAIPLALPFALDAWPTGGGEWLLAVVMGLAGFFAQLLMTQAYGALSVPEASVWLQLTPLLTFLLAVPVLGEPITRTAMLGVVLGMAGVAYGTALGHRQRAPTEPIARRE
jgi:drug/metabolite transporter (DMT)-like permease